MNSSAGPSTKPSGGGVSDEALSRWAVRFSVFHLLCALASPVAAGALSGAVALFGFYGAHSYKREALLVYLVACPLVWVSLVAHVAVGGYVSDPAWVVYLVVSSIMQLMALIFCALLRRRLPQENRILELQDESWL